MTSLKDQTPEESPPVIVSVNGGLDEDVPCSVCGYNLRGLSPGGTCPECGGEIGRSIHQWSQVGRLLKGDPRWVRKLGRAMDLALLSVASAIAAPPLMLIGMLALAHTRPRVHGTAIPILSLVWAIAVWLLPLALGLTASWWFTTAPPENGPALRRWPATLARAAAIAFALGLLLWMGTILTSVFGHGHPPARMVPWGVLIVLFLATGGVFAAGTYAAELAGYLEDSTLSLNTVVMTWVNGTLGFVALAVGAMAAAAQTGATVHTNVGEFLAPVSCVLAAGVPLAGLLTLVLMVWFRVRIVRIIRRGLLGAWRREGED